ncbi:MAG: DinB family protein [Gemmatimonadetes bacterium]|nr:DinB family protein [Gemmatimonadota bacterium]MBK6779932.1 DinB family protein [Gemmatimonadota bacterium]MBK7717551.1 DinB family protein [Gemmatimonadota bacterium]MBK7922193.1 DinB family protein [Gemmatimonadota bacterium]MBK9690097.1 DinB family protein [Gemmatimonadota bacterium]
MSTTGVQSETHRALTALAAMPRQIVRIARGCNDLQLHRNPAPGAWSARDILAHLRACAEVWGRSIDRMITEDQPTIRYISPRGWIKRTNYLEQSFRDSLRAFSEARVGFVDRLSSLEPAAWSRGATFSGARTGADATVLGYARRILDHEAVHLDQIRRTLGR